MNLELEALELNNTWEVTFLPPQKHIIGCKWIFKTKFNPNGTVDRHKARLVVLGNKQQYGIDFAETFAPVANLTTVRTLLVVATMQNWHTCQMVVSNAFLHGELLDTIYMKLPAGYTGIGSRISKNAAPVQCTSNAQLVCKLKKSLYGLRQSLRLWFAKLSSKLMLWGYSQSKADYSLFFIHQPNFVIFVLVYVDDLLICGN